MYSFFPLLTHQSGFELHWLHPIPTIEAQLLLLKNFNFHSKLALFISEFCELVSGKHSFHISLSTCSEEHVDIQKLRYSSLSFLFYVTHYFASSNSISNCCCMNIATLLSDQRYVRFYKKNFKMPDKRQTWYRCPN